MCYFNYEVKLDCITISKKQFEYAKERIHNCGLNEKVNIEIKDYRDLNSKYNSIASIEMIEAVGQNYLESYFKTIKENLAYTDITTNYIYFRLPRLALCDFFFFPINKSLKAILLFQIKLTRLD